VNLQAAECELLNEQQEQLQGVSLEAEQLRQQVQQLRQSTADLPALGEELQELQALLMTRQQLQQEAQDADQIRQQVQQLQDARLDLPALRQELQQLQDAHEEAKAHIAELKEKVGVTRCHLQREATRWCICPMSLAIERAARQAPAVAVTIMAITQRRCTRCSAG
jgi:predicted  nucleic acid-binding Zn-ribbon protein